MFLDPCLYSSLREDFSQRRGAASFGGSENKSHTGGRRNLREDYLHGLQELTKGYLGDRGRKGGFGMYWLGERAILVARQGFEALLRKLDSFVTVRSYRDFFLPQSDLR